ncbi:MAG: hypothetical protein GC178_10100 [Flavobacteriales bacterium]|nr:hypothetical protein [Flavobacteriales bacterium]
MFSELDNGIANLKTAQEQLKVYRQAVLKKAFEGELTKEWRSKQKDLPTAEELLKKIQEERETHYQQQLAEWKVAVKQWEKEGKKGKKPSKPRKLTEFNGFTDECSALLTIESACNYIIDCLHSTAKFQGTGYHCVDTTCIENGRIVWDKIRYVSEETFNQRIQRLKPIAGDILFAREGTVGTTVVLKPNEEVCLGQRMMMFRSVKSVLPEYFMWYFLSNEFILQYKPLIGGTTSPHLNISDIREMQLRAYSVEEQHQIVQEIESRLSVCDKLEESITQSLQKAEALRQSILKKAFEGRLLTAQELAACKKEKDWEPAGELLERIGTDVACSTDVACNVSTKSGRNVSTKSNGNVSITDRTTDRDVARNVSTEKKHP